MLLIMLLTKLKKHLFNFLLKYNEYFLRLVFYVSILKDLFI